MVSSAAGALGPTLECFGVPVVQPPSFDVFSRWFFDAVAARRGGGPSAPQSLFFANAHSLNLAWSDRDFHALLSRADVLLNDGIGVSLYGRLAQQPFAYNFNGTDLFPRLFSEARVAGSLRVFLYGGARGRAERAAENVGARYPGVTVVGTQNGYDGSDAEIVRAINASGADLLLVAKGQPLQERWIDAHKASLEVAVVAGVGALVDFLSGEVSRAPATVRLLRLEWAYRLALEPQRMWKRYVVGNPLFVLRMALERSSGRGATERR